MPKSVTMPDSVTVSPIPVEELSPLLSEPLLLPVELPLSEPLSELPPLLLVLSIEVVDPLPDVEDVPGVVGSVDPVVEDPVEASVSAAGVSSPHPTSAIAVARIIARDCISSFMSA